MTGRWRWRILEASASKAEEVSEGRAPQLARARPRQVVDDVDVLRAFVRSEAGPGVFDDDRGVDVADDRGTDPLAPTFVGRPEHGHLHHARDRRQDVLDLDGVHVDPPGDDQVVTAAVSEAPPPPDTPRTTPRADVRQEYVRGRLGYGNGISGYLTALPAWIDDLTG